VSMYAFELLTGLYSILAFTIATVMEKPTK
jgi:hypothetical protein